MTTRNSSRQRFHNFTIEELERSEYVELVALDEISFRAASMVPHEGIGTQLRPMRLSEVPRDAPVDQRPSKVFVIADLRTGTATPVLASAKRYDVANVAVVLVESWNSDAIALCEKAFGVVLPVLASRTLDPIAAFADAIAAITAPLAANQLGIPCSETSHVLERAGRLSWGLARGTDVRELTERALFTAGLSKTGRPADSVFLHLVTNSMAEYLAELRPVNCSAQQYGHVGSMEISASILEGAIKSISAVATWPERRIRIRRL